MIGHQDPLNAELPDEPYENYSIFDNIRVINLTGSNVPPIVDITPVDTDASEPGPNTGLLTLSRTGSTDAPLSASADAAFDSAGSSTSAITTCMPSAANRSDRPSPIPLAAPVTTATLPGATGLTTLCPQEQTAPYGIGPTGTFVGCPPLK